MLLEVLLVIVLIVQISFLLFIVAKLQNLGSFIHYQLTSINYISITVKNVRTQTNIKSQVWCKVCNLLFDKKITEKLMSSSKNESILISFIFSIFSSECQFKLGTSKLIKIDYFQQSSFCQNVLRWPKFIVYVLIIDYS